MCCLILPFEPQSHHTTYSDLTRKFPYISSRGNQYIIVLYDYDSNSVTAEPVKSRQAGIIQQAFCQLTDNINSRSVRPKMFILDNEISGELKLALKKYEIPYELAPPAQHRRNAAGRDIRTFKNHLIRSLSSLNPNLPMSETPSAPPVTKGVVHENPDYRESWDPHSKGGWYKGITLGHYLCIKAYIPDTGGERVCNTVKCIHHSIPFSQTSTQDYLKIVAIEILNLLHNPKPSNLPFQQLAQDLNEALIKMAEILQRASTNPTPIPLLVSIQKIQNHQFLLPGLFP